MPSGGVGTCQPSAVTVLVELGAELPANPPRPPHCVGSPALHAGLPPFMSPGVWPRWEVMVNSRPRPPTHPQTCLQQAHLCPLRLLPTLLSMVLHCMGPMGIVGFKAEVISVSIPVGNFFPPCGSEPALGSPARV